MARNKTKEFEEPINFEDNERIEINNLYEININERWLEEYPNNLILTFHSGLIRYALSTISFLLFSSLSEIYIKQN